MNKKIKAFSMVGTIVLLIVSAIAIVSLTPMVTRKIINTGINPGGNGRGGHGRYEVFRKDDGKLYSRTCGILICGADKPCPETGCEFDPPKNVENFVVHAIGGGGAGGSAGPDLEVGNNSGNGKNYKKEDLVEIFDIRPDVSNNNYTHSFPHEIIRRTKTLGTDIQTPIYSDITPRSNNAQNPTKDHWLDFDILRKTIGYTFGIACGSAGGEGGDAEFVTPYDPHCWDNTERLGVQWEEDCRSYECCAKECCDEDSGCSCCESALYKYTNCKYIDTKCPNSALYKATRYYTHIEPGSCGGDCPSCPAADKLKDCPWKGLKSKYDSTALEIGGTYTVFQAGGKGGDRPPCVYTAVPLDNFSYVYGMRSIRTANPGKAASRKVEGVVDKVQQTIQETEEFCRKHPSYCE